MRAASNRFKSYGSTGSLTGRNILLNPFENRITAGWEETVWSSTGRWWAEIAAKCTLKGLMDKFFLFSYQVTIWESVELRSDRAWISFGGTRGRPSAILPGSSLPLLVRAFLTREEEACYTNDIHPAVMLWDVGTLDSGVESVPGSETADLGVEMWTWAEILTGSIAPWTRTVWAMLELWGLTLSRPPCVCRTLW